MKISPALTGAALLMAAAPVQQAEKLPPVLSMQTITAEIANRIVVAAVADCTAKGFKVAAAVTGRNGDLLAFLRNPLSGPHTELVSQRKAWSAASFQTATSELTSRTDLSFAPGVLLIQGGVPIEVGGKFYGGVGVSGADPAVDEECSRAGIAAVSDTLEFAE